MPTSYTRTGNISALVGEVSAARAYVRALIPDGEALIDNTGKKILLGYAPVTVADDGTMSVNLPGTNSNDLNVEANTWAYQLVIDYVDLASGRERTWAAPFQLTSSGDFADPGFFDDLSPLAIQSASQYALEAKQYRDQAATITGLTGEDAAIANRLNTPGSASAGAARALADQRISVNAETRTVRRANVVFPNRKTISVEGQEFFVKGANLGFKTGSHYDSWLTEWDWPWLLDAIEQAARAGFNTIRYFGHYRAYEQNRAQFVSRAHQIFEACRTNGLKVMFDFLNNATAPNDLIDWDAYQVAYKEYFADVADGYIDDPLIVSWGVGNELHAFSSDPAQAATVAKFLKVIQFFGPWMKAQDPGTYITASQAANLYDAEAEFKLRAVEPYVDIQTLHYYISPTKDSYGHGALQGLVNVTGKPFMIGEFGSNLDFATGGPHVGNAQAQRTHLEAFSRQLVGSDVNGVLIWKMKDSPSNTTKMGLINSAGQTTPQLDAAMALPDRRLAAVRQYVDASPIPVLVDNFDRAASTTVLGSPELGAAPTVVAGTWGIKNLETGGAYPATRAGSTSDKVVWDCKARRTPLFEAEFIEATNLADVGIIWNYTDTSNFWYMRVYRSSTNSDDNVADVVRNNAGTQITVLSVTFPGLAVQDYARRFRLGVRINGFGFTPYVQGIALPQVKTSSIWRAVVNGSPAGGTFTLTLGGKTTAPIAFNAGPIAVQTAIRAVAPIYAGVTVTESGGAFLILADTAVSGSGAGLTGGTSPSVAVTGLSVPPATANRGVLISASDSASYVASVRSFTESRVAS